MAVVLHYVQIFPMTSKPSGHPYVVRLNDRRERNRRVLLLGREYALIAAEQKTSEAREKNPANVKFAARRGVFVVRDDRESSSRAQAEHPNVSQPSSQRLFDRFSRGYRCGVGPHLSRRFLVSSGRLHFSLLLVLESVNRLTFSARIFRLAVSATSSRN